MLFLALGASIALPRSGRFPAERVPRPLRNAPESVIRARFESDLDTLIRALDSLQGAVARPAQGAQHRAFLVARERYKRAEALTRFYAPGVAAVVDGPLPDDDGDAAPRALGAPAAFARVAASIDGPGARRSQRGDHVDVVLMRRAVASLRSQTRLVTMDVGDLLEAARLEIARVSTLGISGSDAIDRANALPEAADAIDGLRSLFRAAWRTQDRALPVDRARAIDTTLRNAADALRQPPDFDGFDRLGFLVGSAAPAARAISAARSLDAREAEPRRRAWRARAATVFDSGAFDASAYAPEYAPAPTPALVALGRRLFFDARLSGRGTRSCASCHDPGRAFTDGLPRASSFSRVAKTRNTPTLLNAGLQPLLFADERAGSLEEQVGAVLASPVEMQSSAPLAAVRLNADTSYRNEFARAFNAPGDRAVTALAVRVSIAAYVRSLTALNSRFDRAVRGDVAALSPEERHGFNLFMGKAGCGRCHFAPLFGGTAPPDFTSSEPEIIGVPERRDGRSRVDADVGREVVDHVALHRYGFKTPSLRNVAVTGPYMHNGVFSSLEQVVTFYDRGGRASGRVPGRTLSREPLGLTSRERRAVIAFLETLTDTAPRN